MTIEEHIAKLSVECKKLQGQRRLRLKGSNAYKHLTCKIKSIEKQLHYFRKLHNRHLREAKEAEISKLLNATVT